MNCGCFRIASSSLATDVAWKRGTNSPSYASAMSRFVSWVPDRPGRRNPIVRGNPPSLRKWRSLEDRWNFFSFSFRNAQNADQVKNNILLFVKQKCSCNLRKRNAINTRPKYHFANYETERFVEVVQSEARHSCA